MTHRNGNGSVRILLVDDDEEDQLLTRDLLRKSFPHVDVEWAPTYGSALEAARDGEFDACLVDYRLGPDSGIELIREIIAADYDAAVIVLTGQGDHEVDIAAAEAGAAEYLVKGEITPALLERTIRYAIRAHADMRALRESQESLRQAQRMEAISQIASGVAHDFNNMLSAVVGFSDLALMRIGKLDEPQRQKLLEVVHDIEEIQLAGRRAGGVAQQLLAFSRKQMLQPCVLDLNEVLVGLDGLLRQAISDDVELVTELDTGLGAIEADPGQLEQVMVNLAINASDAMPHGGNLTIETHNVQLDDGYADRYIDLTPGPYVLLAVSDTGMGMDEETRRRVFEPFFTTKEVGKGTGLGLATVFGIVKQSGGDIGVYSEPENGTTFKIYLPRVEAAVDTTRPPEEARGAPAGTETILIVDDEELVRHFEEAALVERGYTVLVAASPTHALELAVSHTGTIDLLVTDVVMPKMSGRQLAEELTRSRPGLRTLYTSGYTSTHIVRHGILEPGIAFISKPLDRMSLTTKVRDVLDTV
ncbi:MAG TPA: response regulator [Gaiellaceae bacterium]